MQPHCIRPIATPMHTSSFTAAFAILNCAVDGIFGSVLHSASFVLFLRALDLADRCAPFAIFAR